MVPPSRLRKKCFSMAAVPQLEAAIDDTAVTARVELVPFPSVQESGVFPHLARRLISRLHFLPLTLSGKKLEATVSTRYS
jgi:hypothetical protein